MPVYPGAPESETEPAIGTREGCQRPASPGRKCQTFVLSHFRDARCGCPECGPCRPGPLARRGRPGSDGGGHSSHQGQAGTRCHTTESGMELGYRPVGPDEAPVPDQSSRDGLPERRPRGRRQRQEACTGTIRRAHHPVRKRVCDRPSGHDDAAASGLDLTFRPQVRSPEHLSFLGATAAAAITVAIVKSPDGRLPILADVDQRGIRLDVLPTTHGCGSLPCGRTLRVLVKPPDTACSPWTGESTGSDARQDPLRTGLGEGPADVLRVTLRDGPAARL